MFFFFNDTATTEIYTLSLHDALPIYADQLAAHALLADPPQRFLADKVLLLLELDHPLVAVADLVGVGVVPHVAAQGERSEEHTSELQSRQYLVCRLLLEKKKNIKQYV